jgi:hypothetical protein
MSRLGAARRGVPSHRARAQASRRNRALGPECTEACLRAMRKPVVPAPPAWSSAQPDARRTRQSRESDPTPCRTRRRTTQLRRNPNEPKPVASRPIPGARASERTRAELECERARQRRNPNEPKPVASRPNAGVHKSERTRAARTWSSPELSGIRTNPSRARIRTNPAASEPERTRSS